MKRNFFYAILLMVASVNLLQAQTYDILVAKSGGNYSTVQAAINSVASNKSTRTVIYIQNGTYKEVITVASGKNNITLLGQSNTGVILQYNNAASTINPSTGTAYGTGGSASMFIQGSGFYASTLTIQNSYGAGSQALAISISGDKAVFNNVRFLGNQDTWYGNACRVYLKSCYIEGTTDFMFGSATAFFDGCSIYSKGGTALTAANTDQAAAFGLVYKGCTVTGASGTTTLLGRGWGQYANTAFISCSLPSNISAAGWSDWGNAAADATLRYDEYGNTGSGASTSGRVSWSHKLTSTQAAVYTYLNVLKYPYKSSTADNWDPTAVINGTSGGGVVITGGTVPVTSGGTYSIINKNSSKGLDVTNSSTANGALIQQYNYVGGANQKFIITVVDGVYCKIVNVNSGLGLDVVGQSTANNALIQQYGYNAQANQQFTFVSVGSGYYEIVNRNSGKCLDVLNSSTANNAVVQQYNCVGAANQSWLLTSVKSANPDIDKSNEKAELEIYPSPAANGVFHVVVSNIALFEKFDLEVYNIQGQLVLKNPSFSGSDLVTGLNAGVYIVRVNSGKNTFNGKVLVK